MTLRDDIWNESLQKLIEDGQFRQEDLSFGESKKYTVQRVLANMEELGWLTRAAEGELVWKPGENVFKLSN